MMKKNTKWIGLPIATVLTLSLVAGCSSGQQTAPAAASTGDAAASTEASVADVATTEVTTEEVAAETPEIVYLNVEAPAPAAENGVVSAEEWREIYPEIVESYFANDNNTYRVSYIDENPWMKEFYEGFGFAKDYSSAVGHTYTLDDVSHTERPHPMANCLTCKTPDFTKLVNDMGVEAYKYDFEETFAQMTNPVSCYNCHENNAGKGGELVVTHQYLANAVSKESKEISKEVLVCGQCHNEYYFDPETKATTLPYEDIAGMDPEAIMAYYNDMEFADWTQESTGSKLIKVQHPEMEYILGEGSKHKDLVSCADCHMAKTVSDDGKAYTSHTWESPLANQALLDTCVKCHNDTDMKQKVADIQAEVTARETEVGEKLAALKNALAEAVAAGEMGEEELDAVRALHRSAQFYWDFSFVENSEGAHNSTMAKRVLDLAERDVDEGMKLLGQ